MEIIKKFRKYLYSKEERELIYNAIDYKLLLNLNNSESEIEGYNRLKIEIISRPIKSIFSSNLKIEKPILEKPISIKWLNMGNKFFKWDDEKNKYDEWKI